MVFIGFERGLQRKVDRLAELNNEGSRFETQNNDLSEEQITLFLFSIWDR